MPKLPPSKFTAPPPETYRPGAFLAWQDDAKTATCAGRIADARAAFLDRYGVEATLALVHPDDLPASVADLPAGVEVRVYPQAGRHTVWVGMEVE